MRHSEEFPMPLMPQLPTLPDRSTLMSYIEAFFSRIWPIYPAVDRLSFESDVDSVLDLQATGAYWRDNITLTYAPALAAVYAITSIGMLEVTNAEPELAAEYLTAGYCLHGHLAAIPYLSSCQAQFLMALALRAASKDGQAWHLNGQAIRTAQSLGLHKSINKHLSAQKLDIGHKSQTLHERLWWSCYALEKVLQLECGRPSTVDGNYDVVSAIHPADPNSNPATPYFTAWVALTAIMGQISERLYSRNFIGGSGEMLGETARLDQKLLEWELSLPDQLRPRNAFPDHEDGVHKILASFLSQQYYHV